MDVSENRGTAKSSILIGFSIINHPFWGTPIFWKPPYKWSDIGPLKITSYTPINGRKYLDVSGVINLFHPYKWSYLGPYKNNWFFGAQLVGRNSKYITLKLGGICKNPCVLKMEAEEDLPQKLSTVSQLKMDGQPSCCSVPILGLKVLSSKPLAR